MLDLGLTRPVSIQQLTHEHNFDTQNLCILGEFLCRPEQLPRHMVETSLPDSRDSFGDLIGRMPHPTVALILVGEHDIKFARIILRDSGSVQARSWASCSLTYSPEAHVSAVS